MHDVVANAARDLTHAGRWETAAALVAALPEDVEARRLHAEVLIDQDFWLGTDDAVAVLDDLAGDESWDACSLRARHEYTVRLRRLIAGERPDATLLGTQWEQLLADAPDTRRAAIAHLYAGLTAEVLLEQPDRAAQHYRAVVDGADAYLAGYALRHLGGQADDRGEHEAAQDLWQQSLRLRQRVGHVPGTLAQLQLMADALTVAEVVTMWADELSLHPWLGLSTDRRQPGSYSSP